jgi:hypothetical protein
MVKQVEAKAQKVKNFSLIQKVKDFGSRRCCRWRRRVCWRGRCAWAIGAASIWWIYIFKVWVVEISGYKGIKNKVIGIWP